MRQLLQHRLKCNIVGRTGSVQPRGHWVNTAGFLQAGGVTAPLRAIAGWTGLADCAVAVLNLQELGIYMQAQGWSESDDAVSITVNGNTYLTEFLVACDFSSITPVPLRIDLCDGMQAQGFCVGGCF